MSGRSLRRLPVLGHARYIGTMPFSTVQRGDHGCGKGGRVAIDITVWLDAMEKVVDGQAVERGRLLQQS